MSNITPPPAHGPVNDAGDGQVIPERRAKQGRRGLHMFAVLAISTALAVVLMFGVWGLHAGKLNDAAQASGASKAAAAQSFDAGPSQPKPTPTPGQPRT
jgi:hypothetical protein